MIKLQETLLTEAMHNDYNFSTKFYRIDSSWVVVVDVVDVEHMTEVRDNKNLRDMKKLAPAIKLPFIQ